MILRVVIRGLQCWVPTGAVSPLTRVLASREPKPRCRVLESQPRGSSSALLGTVQFTAAASASVQVGVVYDGTAVPMAGVIAACGLLAVQAQRLLVADWAPGASPRVKRPG